MTDAPCTIQLDDAWHPQLAWNGWLLRIRPGPAWWRDTDTLHLADGRLISRDNGEFGGAIWWESISSVRDTFYYDNPFAFVRTERGIYALTGLAHMVLDTGSVVALRRDSAGRWSAEALLDLGASPRAMARLGGDTLLVATSDSLLQVILPNHKQGLHHHPGAPYSSATSIIRDRNNVLYVGMESAVARLTPTAAGYEETWLVPSGCVYEQPNGRQLVNECECMPH